MPYRIPNASHKSGTAFLSLFITFPDAEVLIDGDEVIQIPHAVLVLHPLPGGPGDVPPADPPPGPRHQENEPVDTDVKTS